jgi:hypothetical protein
MKSTQDKQIRSMLAYELKEALTHFFGRLVCEGDND